MRRSTRNAVLLPALSVLGWVITPPAPAAADHFSGATGNTANCDLGDGGGVNMTDNADWVWNYHELAGVTLAALEWARVTIFEPTDHTTSVTENPSPNTDMVAYDRDYIDYCYIDWDGGAFGNVVGLTTCMSTFTNGRCNRHEVRYDLPDMQALSTSQQIGLACHETGHATGLMHRDNPTNLDAYRGCMYTGGPYKDYLSPHDINVINANY